MDIVKSFDNDESHIINIISEYNKDVKIAQGDIAEQEFIYRCMLNGIHVSKPLSNNLPYDSVIDIKGKLYRVQVKSSYNYKDGVIIFNIRQGSYVDGKRISVPYNKEHIDLLYLYNAVHNEGYLFSIDELHNSKTNQLKQKIIIRKESLVRNKNSVLSSDHLFEIKIGKILS